MTESAHPSGNRSSGKHGPSGNNDAGNVEPGRRTSRIAGLRPAVPAACRAALRAGAAGEAGESVPEGALETGAHAGCPRCASIESFRERFAPLLAQRPTPPAVLASRAFLDSVLERIVDNSADVAEHWLRLPPRSAEAAWPEELLESPVAASVAATAPRAHVSTASWDQLRRTILANVDAHKV